MSNIVNRTEMTHGESLQFFLPAEPVHLVSRAAFHSRHSIAGAASRAIPSMFGLRSTPTTHPQSPNPPLLDVGEDSAAHHKTRPLPPRLHLCQQLLHLGPERLHHQRVFALR